MKGSNLTRRTAFKRSCTPKPKKTPSTAIVAKKKGMRQLGKRGLEWAKIRIELKEEFRAMGIERCEVCGSSFNISWGHAVKRRYLRKDAPIGHPEHIKTVVLLCVSPCHESIEKLPHDQMRNRVMQIISERQYK